MKTVQPIYEVLKPLLKENKTIYIRLGKSRARIQSCYKDKKGITFALSSVGEHRLDLFSELYIE